MKLATDAVEQVRRAEHKALKRRGDDTLIGTKHLDSILTYCKHRITNGAAEGLNSKIMTIKRLAAGFRNREHFKTAIYFHRGGLDLDPR